jgi:hypothetical protein
MLNIFVAFLASLEPCWKDRTCLATVAAVASGIGVLGRRWDVLHKVQRNNTRDRVAFVFGGALVNLVASFFLTMLAVRAWPLGSNHEFAVPIVVFGAIAFDWGSDSGIELIRRIFKREVKKWTGINLDEPTTENREGSGNGPTPS